MDSSKLERTYVSMRLDYVGHHILMIICLTIDKIRSRHCTVKVNVSYMLNNVYCLS